MTPNELARVPEGGYTWKWSNCGFWAEVYEGMGLVCRVNKRNARQIVGSVNAAILTDSPYFEYNCEDHIDKNEIQVWNDYHFWLDYAKGSK